MADLNENKPGLSAEALAKAGYKKTKVGWIPEEWDYELIEKYAVRGSGHTPDKKVPEYYNGGIKWVSLTDSNKLDKRYIEETEIEISQAGIENSSAVLHQKGTVILSRDAGVGKSAILGENMAVSQHFMTWNCGFELDNIYLYYYLQYQKPFFERMASGSTIKTIGLGFFKKYKIVHPPLSEQRQIATLLSTWDAAIDKLGQLIAKKQALKKGLMQQLLSGRVRFPEFVPAGGTRYKETKVGWVPEDWEVVKLGEVAKPVSRKNAAQNAEVVLTASAQYGLVDQISFFNKSVSGKDLSKYYLLKKGEFAYNRSYSTGYDYGAIKRLYRYDEGVLSTLYICFSVEDRDISNYLTYYFETRLIQRELFSIVQEGARNHGLLNVSKSDFYEVKILLPPNGEMRKIFSFLTEVDLEITKLKQEKSGLQTQKKGLMQQLLTGAVRITE